MIVPAYFLIEQTNACQLRCPCCPHQLKQRPQGYMRADLFRRIIDDILAHVPTARAQRIALHGFGEPLLNPDLWPNLDHLEHHGFKNVDFSTNGMALNAEARQRLSQYSCLSWIRVSINSSRPELMERINEGANYNRVVENFKALIATKPKARVVTQFMQTRANEDESMAAFVDAIGDVPVMVKRMDTLGNQVDDAGLAYPSTVPPGCFFANHSFYIHWDGDVVGCCLDDTKSQVIGNAKDGLFTEAFARRISEMRRDLAERRFDRLPFCGKCYGHA